MASSTIRRPARPAAVALGLLVAVLAMLAARADSAPASEITSFSAVPSTTQAGGHPDVALNVSYTARIFSGTNPTTACNCDDAKRISFHFPTGFIGDPHPLPECSEAELAVGQCSPASQLGVSRASGFGGYAPIYNMQPHTGQGGLSAFIIPFIGAPFYLSLSGRTDSDYGLDSISGIIPHFFVFSPSSLEIHLWGVPADPIHDPARFFTPLDPSGVCGGQYPNPCSGVTGAAANLPLRPVLQNPTTCGVALTARVDIDFYDGSTAHADHPWPATTGCQQLSFNPSLTATPTTSQADTASGIDITLKVPQTQSPTTPSPSEIRSNTVTLPEGFTINPGAADGKLACSDSDTAIGTLGPATCPEFSKVGTTSIDVAALPGPIPGALYLGEPKPGDPYRLILTADGFGTHVKLVGEVHADPATGRVTTVFNSPQTNLQEVALHFFGSERGLLATPTQCGTHAVQSEFVPWDNLLETQHSITYFTIDTGPGGTPCPGGNRPFAPTLRAGSANANAGVHSPFSLQVSRSDGDQFLTGLSVKAPPGFSATLKGIPYCPETAIARLADPSYAGLAEQSSPACPSASQVGTVTAGAGAGTHPLHVPGKAYLAGPYKGAPLSLLVVVPAISGPYDLGNVAVRATISVDPTTAQVTTLSDPLPHILEGIPLRTRTVQVNLDRPGFALNPTNCDPFSVEASVFGEQGAVATPSAHFQVANCADLAFAPKLSLALRGSAKRRGHPALRARLSAEPGGANVARASVALPKALILDNARIGTVCTRPKLAAGACPPGSRIGEAKALSPLLEQPLKGSVYLVAGPNKLPDVLAALRGQLAIDLRGTIDTPKGGGLRTTFETIPDVPVSSFELDLAGGSKGLIVNSENLCKGPGPAMVKLAGQNGKRVNRKISLRPSCGKARQGKRRLQRATEVG